MGCRAEDCGGVLGRMGTAQDGIEEDGFSAAFSVAMWTAICSCLAASCSRLRRTRARSRTMGSSCCTNLGDVEPATAEFVVETGNNWPSDGDQALIISFASSP